MKTMFCRVAQQRDISFIWIAIPVQWFLLPSDDNRLRIIENIFFQNLYFIIHWISLIMEQTLITGDSSKRMIPLPTSIGSLSNEFYRRLISISVVLYNQCCILFSVSLSIFQFIQIIEEIYYFS